jgi:hypothetical protein
LELDSGADKTHQSTLGSQSFMIIKGWNIMSFLTLSRDPSEVQYNMQRTVDSFSVLISPCWWS